MPDAKVFLTSGGGDSIDVAAKLARRHFVLARPARARAPDLAHPGLPRHARLRHLARRDRGQRRPTGARSSRRPRPSRSTRCRRWRRRSARVGPDTVAAFFCEPVIGAGGVHPPPEGYIQGVADLCAEHGILLVIDSVICGFGRLGTWFGVERWEDVRPAMITFAKGVTSGYLPLGGVVVGEEVAAPYFAEPGGPMFRHGATYAGHPSACAAALAMLDIYEREDMIPPRAGARAAAATTRWRRWRDHPAVGEVRGGLGFLAAVALAPDRAGVARSLRARARRACSCGRCSAASRSRRR